MQYSDEDIVKGCLKNEKFFQEILYKENAAKMFGICLRYAPNRDTANDMFQEGFIKVFQNLRQFKGQSALSSWMYRIFITTSINYIQRKLKVGFEVSINDQMNQIEDTVTEEEAQHWMENVSVEEALAMVQELPEKYRLVINLYAVDKLNHSEISKLLGITETTSRSQLSRARKLLSEKLSHQMRRKFGE